VTTSTSEAIVLKLYHAVDTIGRIDNQRIIQWIELLRRRPADEVFNALVGVFCNTDRPTCCYLDQEYAGRLLLAVKPPCSQDIQSVIKRTLATWDLSIEELPFYFSDVFGAEAVLQALDALDRVDNSQQEKKAIRTFRFWLHARRDN
jgi:hypothetical protein